MKRVYEELFIVRPDATDEETDPLVEQLTNTIASRGGNVDKTEKWGVRKLAYRVKKYNEGIYILLHFTAEPDTVKEVERRLRVSDMVLKFITVRTDQKMKKIDKRRKAREKRAARRPAPSVAAPSLPTAEPTGIPGAPGGPMPGAPMPGAPAHAAPAPPAAAPAAAPAAPPAAAPAASPETGATHSEPGTQGAE